MSRIIWGVSALYHDAAISVVKDESILFAAHSERYSRIKNDKDLNLEIINECLRYGHPDEIVWYENPVLKKIRNIFIDRNYQNNNPSEYLKSFNLNTKISYSYHHKSHLCSSLYTAPFKADNTLGVVIDSVGELDTTSFWHIKNNKIKKIYSRKYPNSLGLFYSSITKLIELKPQEEEYIMMGMAAYGTGMTFYNYFKKHFFDKSYNLVIDLRRGCNGIFDKETISKHKFDIAYGAQKLYEDILVALVKKYLYKTKADSIVFSGGCALNCSANTQLLELVDSDKVWVFPNPGDSGASLGAALSLNNKKVEFKNLFLGSDAGVINDTNHIVEYINANKVAGIINGRAEFGPRALGNRSILADPRVKNIKDVVNNIKGRELFRPFAPMVLKDRANSIFKIPHNNFPYMSYIFECKQPDVYPGIVHEDGTSRIQTVDENSGWVYKLLKNWHLQTGCPILLNTSLNIKGKPLLNSSKDIEEFKSKDLKIFSS